MAGLNIAEWSPEQVAEWMTGLGPPVAQYTERLRERGLDGRRLLLLRCDDLEYLGMRIIGHQELLLEAVEQLRNFQYELDRECVQQLAVRVSGVATSLCRALLASGGAGGAPGGGRLDTQTLADVARTVRAVKPLACWLEAAGGGAERRAALLRLALEAAACAQRERFADQPARLVYAAAAAAADAADAIVRDDPDPGVLRPAALLAVSLQQGARPLGFDVAPSVGGHRQVAHVRFGSPAHASGAVREGDEIVQVGTRCVIGWGGEAVRAACEAQARTAAAAGRGGELSLRLRRRARPARPAPAAAPLAAARLRVRRAQRLLAHHDYDVLRISPTCPSRVIVKEEIPEEGSARGDSGDGADAGAAPGAGEVVVGGGAAPAAGADVEGGESSDDSEALSPPASPSHLTHDHTRMYPPKPRSLVQRRYTISGGSPVSKRPPHSIEQFWQELRAQQWAHDSTSLYRRDKAVSYSTGLSELTPRPATCLGVALPRPLRGRRGRGRGEGADPPTTPTALSDDDRGRGKLDKSHSTPAYDFDAPPADEPGPLAAQVIPESPPAAPDPPAPLAPLAPTPADSPTVLVHSAEKADQILEFKKSSSQIGEAILQQRSRRTTLVERDGDGDGDGDAPGEGEVARVLETINIAVLERHRGREALAGREPGAAGGAGGAGKPFSVSEHVRCIQEELVQAITQQRLASARAARAPAAPPSPPPRPAPREYPSLRAVPGAGATGTGSEYNSPIKPLRGGAGAQISLPLRHLTKHDICVVGAGGGGVVGGERGDLPAINGEPSAPDSPAPAPAPRLTPLSPSRDAVPVAKAKSLKKKNSLQAKRRAVPLAVAAARGPSGEAWQRVRVRGAGGGGGGGDAGAAGGEGAQWRWARRRLALCEGALYVYARGGAGAGRAACRVRLRGCTAAVAPEVRSRQHAFKVYHTGTAFYFAADSPDAMRAWVQLVAAAALAHDTPPHAHTHKRHDKQTDTSSFYSETDYSETESDIEEAGTDAGLDGGEGEGAGVPGMGAGAGAAAGKDKDKSKFGSLKKLTHRAQRSDSQESVSHASTSLDRKYLRFFSRGKHKDDAKESKENKTKGKQPPGGVPVPTGHYRSYRRVSSHTPAPTASNAGPSPPAHDAPPAAPAAAPAPASRLPKPLTYIHASNPNLLDFEKSDFVTKPALQLSSSKSSAGSAGAGAGAGAGSSGKPESLLGFVTLEQFMLQKQAEERRQVYNNRVLMGVERSGRHDKHAHKELQKRLERIVPDVIYGEVAGGGGVEAESGDGGGSRAARLAGGVPLPVLEHLQARGLPAAPAPAPAATPPAPPRGLPAPAGDGKPISVKGKDGYEKIVYPDEQPSPEDEPRPAPAPAPAPAPRAPPRAPGTPTAADLGYETIYGDEAEPPRTGVGVAPPVAPRAPERPWRESLRRNDKVHSGGVTLKSAAQYRPPPRPPIALVPAPAPAPTPVPAPAPAPAAAPDSWTSAEAGAGAGGGGGGGGGGSGGVSRLRLMFSQHQERGSVSSGGSGGSTPAHTAGSAPAPAPTLTPTATPAAHYPHLQCPPTFHPETYSLARLAPSAPTTPSAPPRYPP